MNSVIELNIYGNVIRDTCRPRPKCAREVLKHLCTADNATSSLATVLSRILVCKPHSANCERLISAYNRLKSVDSDKQLAIIILYINVNMPVLCNFDPRPAVLNGFVIKTGGAQNHAKLQGSPGFKTSLVNVMCQVQCHTVNIQLGLYCRPLCS